MKKNTKWLLYLLAVCLLVFIWSNSFQNQSQSVSRSNSVKQFVIEKLSYVFSPDSKIIIFIQLYIRKCAHFIEFTLLGTVLMSILYKCKRVRLQSVYNIFSFSVIVAVIDEFVQIYTGRGPRVKDIVIDSTGSICGIFLAFDIHWICIFAGYVTARIKKKQYQETP